MAKHHFEGSLQNLGICFKKENPVFKKENPVFKEANPAFKKGNPVFKKVIPDFKKGTLFSKREIPFSRRDILFSKIWSLLWAHVWAHVEPRVAKEPIWSQGGYKIDDIMKLFGRRTGRRWLKPCVFLIFRRHVPKRLCVFF